MCLTLFRLNIEDVVLSLNLLDLYDAFLTFLWLFWVAGEWSRLFAVCDFELVSKSVSPKNRIVFVCDSLDKEDLTGRCVELLIDVLDRFTFDLACIE